MKLSYAEPIALNSSLGSPDDPRSAQDRRNEQVDWRVAPMHDQARTIELTAVQFWSDGNHIGARTFYDEHVVPELRKQMDLERNGKSKCWTPYGISKSVAGLTQAQLEAHERAKAMFNISTPLAARSGFPETMLDCRPWADHATWSAWRLGRWQHLNAPHTAMLSPWSEHLDESRAEFGAKKRYMVPGGCWGRA